jgi:hypothetical protein
MIDAACAALMDPLMFSPSDIQNPLLQRLYAYWESCRGSRPMPARADIDPVDMQFILGNLYLVDVMREPLRFRMRLHGTELVRRAGHDLTGKILDTLPQTDFRASAQRAFTAVVESGMPRWERQNRTVDNRTLSYESLILPLSQDGVAVEMLLVGMVYLN